MNIHAKPRIAIGNLFRDTFAPLNNDEFSAKGVRRNEVGFAAILCGSDQRERVFASQRRVGRALARA